LATIYYTLDNSEPNQESSVYTDSIELFESTTIKARAYLDGWIGSPIMSTEYYQLMPPCNLMVFQVSVGVYLSWTAPQTQSKRSQLHSAKPMATNKRLRNTQLSAYRIYRDGTYLTQSQTPGYMDTEIEYGVEYSYQVTAVYSSVESSTSNTVNIIPMEDTYSELMQYDNETNTYSASINTGLGADEVPVQFSAEQILDSSVVLLYSTNPTMVNGFGNPEALGAYFSFTLLPSAYVYPIYPIICGIE
jgi:hypothetical protein